MDARKSVKINDAYLSTISPHIFVNKIKEEPVQYKIGTTMHGNHIGEYLSYKGRQFIEMSIEFAILTEDLTTHMAQLSAIRKAFDGCQTLHVGYRADMHLNCFCTQMPQYDCSKTLMEAKYKAVFRASEIPYWQSDSVNTANLLQGNIITNTGSAQTYADVQITFSGQCDTISMSARESATSTASSYMLFDGLSIKSGDVFKLYHSGSYIMASLNDQDVLMNRNISSDDDMILKSGVNYVNVYASNASQKIVKYRKRWL